MNFKDIYLIFNFTIGSIYIFWIYWLMYYKKCKCSKTNLQTYIHIYWYVIFILDILIFFSIFNIDNFYLIIFGNILGLINIYMTYKYIEQIKNCSCSNDYMKDLIVIIYISTVIISMFYAIGYFINKIFYGK